MSSSETTLTPETVLVLRDRLKHGQNVAKILESQVDTAQQNIVLLQGQVRLANETISNLKKYFQETENLLTKLFEPDPQVRSYEPVVKEVSKDHASPILQDSGTESNKSFDGKGESNKSPYAQQLRQVLDVLQDEEPRSHVHGVGKRSEYHPGHCGGKCQCHAFVNYVPYGYHVIESSPGIPESIQPISPSARRKRAYVPHMGGEEPPHLKYTKVKRIDGNKLTAQKMLQDFTKRRFFTYNPRYDLDLLIVAPPIPAVDLMKDGKNGGVKVPRTLLNVEEHIPEPHQVSNTNSERTEGINGINALEEDVNNHDNSDHQNTLGTENGNDAITTTCCSNVDNLSDTNNNSITTTVINNISNSMNNSYVHALFKSPCSNLKLLPAIKEENVEGRKRLETHIAMMRAESHVRNVSVLNQECSYSLGMKQERTLSPITVGSNCI